ncbi:MAG TPA: CRISPR-associated protein [Campylobacterales bacterium]|nr:CRISPR-associated protein [Sulfurospirillum arcachonense]HIP51764.1 CRISPR-associated protein [Campylobacterales bacterium]
MTLKYEVKFLDYWHLSSGLSAGAKLDSTVVKDKNGLPYLSGKTLKGLLREMAELLKEESFVKSCFGDEGVDMGICYFSNATLPSTLSKEIKEHNLQERLYDVLASTKIGEKDIAVTNSLREIEVVVPISLEGYIDDVPTEYKEQLIASLKMIKRMGLNRNRGLGRCEITVEVV